jgi:hypothetical protein
VETTVNATAAHPPSTVISHGAPFSSEGPARPRIGNRVNLPLPAEHVHVLDTVDQAFLRNVEAAPQAA